MCFLYLIYKLASQLCKAKNVIAMLPFSVWRELMIKLDPLRQLKGDFRDLADKMGFDVERIFKFQAMSSPTQAVLKGCMKVTIDDLMVKLEEIGRDDAKRDVERWIRANCQCARCHN